MVKLKMIGTNMMYNHPYIIDSETNENILDVSNDNTPETNINQNAKFHYGCINDKFFVISKSYYNHPLTNDMIINLVK